MSQTVLLSRIVTVDSYQSSPIRGLDPTYSDFNHTVVNQVPVLRIFGITTSGAKACVQVHGVFPYIYIPLPDNVDNNDAFLYRLNSSINEAINAGYEQHGPNKKSHVFKMTVVKGIPFYGYHTQTRNFVKTYFYRPSVIKKVATLLQNGSLLNRSFQPHEAHVPYILQFFIDFNLFGMSHLSCSKFTARIDETEVIPSVAEVKTTYCQFEFDVIADDITNSAALDGEPGMNPGLAYIWEEEKERRRNEGKSEELSMREIQNDDRILWCSENETELKGLLVQALKERLRGVGQSGNFSQTDSSIFESSMRESHHDSAILDERDWSVLNAVRARLEEEADSNDENDWPEDSVLGSQRVQNDQPVSEDELDMTRPLELSDDEEVAEVDRSKEEIAHANFSSDDDMFPMYVDGQFDDIEPTPKKMKPSTPTALSKSVERSVSKDSPSKEFFTKMALISQSFVKKNLSNDASMNTSCSSSSGESRDNLRSRKISISQGSVPHGITSLESKKDKKRPSTEPILVFEEMAGTSDSLQVASTQSTVSITSQEVSSQSTDITPSGSGSRRYTTRESPPSLSNVLESLKSLNLRKTRLIKPFYGNPEDIASTKEVGLTTVGVSTKFAPDLQEFAGTFSSRLNAVQKRFLDGILALQGDDCVKYSGNALKTLASNRKILVCPVEEPPSFDEVKTWLSDVKRQQKLSKVDLQADKKAESTVRKSSLVSSAEDSSVHVHSGESFTQKSSRSSRMCTIIESRRNSHNIEEMSINSGPYKLEFQNLQECRVTSVHKYLTVFALELHVNTRGDLNPDPEHDAIDAVFYCVSNDVPTDFTVPQLVTGLVMVSTNPKYRVALDNCSVTVVQTEQDLFSKILDIIREHDPDILAGYEIEMLSWGYLVQRGYVLGLNLYNDLSRLKNPTVSRGEMEAMKNRDYEMKFPGRIVLNVWRLMRHEAPLMSYTFESMMYHVLHTRVPKYSFKTLTFWWNNMQSNLRILTIKYYLTRVQGMLKVMDSLDFVGRTSELASLFGIQFFEVLSRGSQFRVESMMLRMAKPINYVAVSPSVEQRAHMRAPAALPLIMEPLSRFYTDPVIVLDFQSLYPSIMIAYNYCFSTCLGRVEELLELEIFKFGCTELKIDSKELYKLKNHMSISPSGTGFVNSSVRKGVLPRMLEQILETRLMVKDSMKSHKDDKLLHRVLDARQLGLKLIANVTYGYTSANFSGRMPCIELGDSVVSKGRETLERAIKLVNTTSKWEAQVVYGDTDSMFVLCPGKTKEEAFAIGREISEAVTNSNPKPVKLKLEKVYYPCILQTKKRYVGYSYESPDQSKPNFDAKGIETVRRDGCVAVSKILEKSLRILFETYDVSKIKQYLCLQLTKIVTNNMNLQDFIFAKEYRGMHGYKPGACVPALKLSRDWVAKDRRSEPRVSERVGYVVVYGPPGLPIIRLVRAPHEVLNDPSLQLNAEYYITKVIIPPLQRCLTLLGVDAFLWYKTVPKSKKMNRPFHCGPSTSKKATLSQYFSTVNCVVCQDLTTAPVCEKCRCDEQKLFATLWNRIAVAERRECLLKTVCETCCGRAYEIECQSLDCPVYYRRKLSSVKYNQTVQYRNLLDTLELQGQVEEMF